MSDVSQTSGEAQNIANFPLATIGSAQPACPICGALVAWNGTRSHLRWHDDQEVETLLAGGTPEESDDEALACQMKDYLQWKHSQRVTLYPLKQMIRDLRLARQDVPNE